MSDLDLVRILEAQNAAPIISKPAKLPTNHERDAIASLTPTQPISGPAIKVVIAQNETISRESLRTLLQREAALSVVGTCPNGEESLLLARELKPKVLLLDICILQQEGIDVLRQLKEREPDVKVILLCQSITKEDIVRFLQLGVRGILHKNDPTDALFECIQKVARGEYWLGADGIMTLVQSVIDLGKSKGIPKSKYGLTPRENEVILKVLEGYSNPEIAAHFSLSEQTVKHHLSHIFDKLGVYSRLELALFAVNHHVSSE